MSTVTGLYKDHITSMVSLGDMNENKDIGTFFSSKDIGKDKANEGFRVTMCQVKDALCITKDEWDTMVKPYMEN